MTRRMLMVMLIRGSHCCVFKAVEKMNIYLVIEM